MKNMLRLACLLLPAAAAVPVAPKTIDLVTVGGLVTFGGPAPHPQPNPPPTGCTKDGCLFSFTDQASVHGFFGRCGEVDAAPRMPADMWQDSNAVAEYVNATLEYYHPGRLLYNFKQKPCERADRKQKGNRTVPWTNPRLMSVTCTTRCNCTYPDCPDVPDRPRVHSYCSLCGPKFNADIEVKFWINATAPDGPN